MCHTDAETRYIKVNILYKTGKPFKDVLIAKCKNRAIGAKKAPSWKKMFPTGEIIFSNWKLEIRGLSQKSAISSLFYVYPPKKALTLHGKMF